ncbi:MAG: transposase [Chloracidobacterium sp.]|nr:transposase [Chloracidobacterium sp.]
MVCIIAICSNCGHRNQKPTLSEHYWTCPACGVRHYRDRNAAGRFRPVPSDLIFTSTTNPGRFSLNVH